MAINIKGLVAHMDESIGSLTASLKMCEYYVPNVRKTQHFLSPDFEPKEGQREVVMGKGLRETKV